MDRTGERLSSTVRATVTGSVSQGTPALDKERHLNADSRKHFPDMYRALEWMVVAFLDQRTRTQLPLDGRAWAEGCGVLSVRW